MNNEPKISIVTASYNSGKYIRETILSTLSQNYDNFEYFVIDGGSTDKTVEILKEFGNDEKYKYKFKWISEKDKGQTDAINKGLRMCTGDWFAFLNADDCYYDPDVFNKLAPFMTNHLDKGIIYGNCVTFFEELDSSYDVLNIPPEKVCFISLLYGNKIYGPASFYNMKALKRVGEFDATLCYWMDWDMYLRISKIMELKYVNIFVTKFRITKDMKSQTAVGNNKARRYFMKEAHLVSRKHGGRYFSRLLLNRIRFIDLYFYYRGKIRKNKSILGQEEFRKKCS